MPTTTPNMNLVLPEPTVTSGPEWAATLNTALTAVDNHDHSSDNGKKVTPSGLDINADLDLQNQSIKNTYKVKLVNQAAALTGVPNACSVSFVSGNFYITNSGGVAVQVTNGTSVVNTTIIPASPLMPAGTVLDYAGITVPPGFLAADGTNVSRVTYSDLFTSIGTAYGVGDGSSTFALPNFNGRAAIGSGSYTDSGTAGSVSRSLGQLLGESVHTLTIAELASHNHTQAAHNHNSPIPLPRGAGLGAGPYSLLDTTIGYTTTASDYATPVINNTGSSTAHNNMQPSIVINKIIKY